MSDNSVGLLQRIESEAFITWVYCSVAFLIFAYVVAYIATRMYYQHRINASTDTVPNDEMARKLANEPEKAALILFEIIITNFCIIVSFAIYNFLVENLPFLGDFSSYIMLVLIIITIQFNKAIDIKLEQNVLSDDDKTNIRLLCSLAVIVFFVFFVIKYRTKSYGDFLSCYSALVLGRFVFYDSTWKKSVVDTLEPCFRMRYLIPLLVDILFTYAVFIMGVHFSLISDANMVGALVLIHIVLILCIHIAKRIIRIFSSVSF